MQSQQRVADLLSSISWKVTWPLRILVVIFMAPVRFSVWLIKLPSRVVKGTLNRVITFTLSRPKLTSRIIAVLDKFPPLKRLMISLTFRVRGASLTQASQHLDAGASAGSEALEESASDAGMLDLPQRPRGMNYENMSPLEKKGP